MIATLVLFGATGDLAERFLLPALGRLRLAGRLPDEFRLVGSAHSELDDEEFRAHAASELAQHAGDLPAELVDDLLSRLEYVFADATDAESVARVIERAGDGPLVAYLALPVGLVAPAITAVAAGGLTSGSRIVVEKPFGENLQDAERLNALLDEVGAGADGPIDAFRVDHALGMEPLWRALPLRFSTLGGADWDSTRVERVEVLWEETLALEGRAAFYDGAGALRDVVQNHVMQVLSLFAMEEPADLADLRQHKTDVLNAIRPLSLDEAAAASRRGRYTAGRLADDADGQSRDVPSYVDEHGVDPARGTETFAELTLHIDTPRWSGVPFVLRAGKALPMRRKGVLAHLRENSEPGLFRRVRVRCGWGSTAPTTSAWKCRDRPGRSAMRVRSTCAPTR